MLSVDGNYLLFRTTRPKSWWTAQALLYDLSCPKTSSITAIRALLEAAIKANKLEVPKRLRDIENKANRDFKKLNKEVLEKTGATGTTSTSKKTVDKPAKPTAETASTSKSKTNLAKKPPKPAERNDATSSQDHVQPKTRTKQTAKRSAPSDDDDIEIVSHSSPTKRAKVEPKPKMEQVPAFDDNYMQIDDHYGEYDGPSSSNAPAYSGPPPSDPVAGTYTITCPRITQQWSHYNVLSLNVVRTHARQHIQADFDFGLVHGVIRSKTMEGRTDGGVYVTFEWVGDEDQRPIAFPRKSQSGYIKFSRDAGSAMPILKGKINDFSGFGDFEFSGEWVGPPNRNNYHWDDFNEEAYERARVGRWH
jgi:hypothetical protein